MSNKNLRRLSKDSFQNEIIKTFPEWKSPLLSVDFMSIQMYKKLNSAEKKLHEKETEIEFHNTEMHNKWKELKKKKEEFLEDIEDYDIFSAENEQKLKRVQEKISFENDFQKSCKGEIESIKRRNDYLTNVESQITQSVETLQPYGDFLENLVQEMGIYKSTEELINYYILQNSEASLQKVLGENLQNAELLHTEIIKELKKQIDSITKENETLFENKNESDNEKNILNKWTVKNSQLQQLKNKQFEEINTIKQSCNNIYQKLSKWRKTNTVGMNEVKKLEFVENTITELQQAVQLAHKLSNKDDISHEANSSFISIKRAI